MKSANQEDLRGVRFRRTQSQWKVKSHHNDGKDTDGNSNLQLENASMHSQAPHKTPDIAFASSSPWKKPEFNIVQNMAHLRLAVAGAIIQNVCRSIFDENTKEIMIQTVWKRRCRTLFCLKLYFVFSCWKSRFESKALYKYLS